MKQNRKFRGRMAAADDPYLSNEARTGRFLTLINPQGRVLRCSWRRLSSWGDMLQAVLCLALAAAARALYLPGVAPLDFAKDDIAYFKARGTAHVACRRRLAHRRPQVNSLVSAKSALPIEYYTLPFCRRASRVWPFGWSSPVPADPQRSSPARKTLAKCCAATASTTRSTRRVLCCAQTTLLRH
jgi:hypothetical protein